MTIRWVKDAIRYLVPNSAAVTSAGQHDFPRTLVERMISANDLHAVAGLVFLDFILSIARFPLIAPVIRPATGPAL
jgi:hypothetical protein